MTKGQKNVLIGVAALAAYFFLIRRDSPERVGSSQAPGGVTERERDALARLLWAETSMIGPEDEHAGIVWVALNRASDPRFSILDVATPPGRSGQGVWNNGSVFRERWKDAPDYRSFAKARQVVDGVLSGRIPNPIGTSRKLFVHPKGLKRCELQAGVAGGGVYTTGEAAGKAIGSRRRCVAGRALPAWSVAKADGGTAPTRPLQVGRGLFS